MAKTRNKFGDPVIYTDEITNVNHPIQLYAINDNGHRTFEADVRRPLQFVDYDENVNTLIARVFTRLKDGHKREWTPYLLVTISDEGFEKTPLDFSPTSQNQYGIKLQFEPFEVTVLGDGTQMWRGVAGKSHRLSPQAKPNWPETGKTDRGGYKRYFADTPENRELLMAIQDAFAGARRAIKHAIKTKNTKATWNTLCGYAEQWNSFDEVIRKQGTPNPEDEQCPETTPVASSEPSAAIADAPSASPTANASPAT